MHMVKLSTKIGFLFAFLTNIFWASDNVYYFLFTSTWKHHAVIYRFVSKSKVFFPVKITHSRCLLFLNTYHDFVLYFSLTASSQQRTLPESLPTPPAIS